MSIDTSILSALADRGHASGPDDEAVFAAARTADLPLLGPQSLRQDGVSEGSLNTLRHEGRGVYPGVVREVTVYRPAQRDPAISANLIVFQDARLYLAANVAAPVVLDNLIARGELPPTVAVFIEPGDLPGQAAGTRGNRSFEYDTLDDAYLRFLLEELLPDVIGDLDISADPTRRAICGMSSGGICAFNAAWERPESFGRVISHVGSYTNIRGGHAYPSRVRANPPKPIRVFLQGGAHDLDNRYGNWAIANHDMAAALRFSGYDYRFEFGRGGHDLTHAGAIFPQTLRWLFRP